MNDEPAQPARARRAHPRPVTGSRVKRASDFLNLKLETRVRLLEEMTTLECAQLFHDWAFWARPEQAPPDGDWIIWLILAGRGVGKTRAGAEAVRTWVQTYPIVNLIGATIADARDIMVRGDPAFSLAAGATSVPAFSQLTFGSNGRTAR
jgi:phage terminase large subunit-like protein